MIKPKNDDRTWTKAIWKFLHRYERCVNRVMGPKLEKAITDQLLYGYGQWEITEADSFEVAEWMKGKKP